MSNWLLELVSTPELEKFRFCSVERSEPGWFGLGKRRSSLRATGSMRLPGTPATGWNGVPTSLGLPVLTKVARLSKGIKVERTAPADRPLPNGSVGLLEKTPE